MSYSRKRIPNKNRSNQKTKLKSRKKNTQASSRRRKMKSRQMSQNRRIDEITSKRREGTINILEEGRSGIINKAIIGKMKTNNTKKMIILRRMTKVLHLKRRTPNTRISSS